MSRHERDLFCVGLLVIVALFLLYLSSCSGDPPHGPDASLPDILLHILKDRQSMHLDNTPLTQEAVKALKLPYWEPDPFIANAYILFGGRQTRDTWRLYYVPSAKDWDISVV